MSNPTPSNLAQSVFQRLRNYAKEVCKTDVQEDGLESDYSLTKKVGMTSGTDQTQFIAVYPVN